MMGIFLTPLAMHLSSIEIDKFRCISSLILKFDKGINLILGENDSGKSAIIDAIKLVTGTQSNDWIRLVKDDFFTDGTERAKDLKITCHFEELSNDEAAAFLEWLSIKDNKYYLKITLIGRRSESKNIANEVFFDIRAGEDEESGLLSSEAKNKLRVTYLKPLRDAEYELAPRKGSRLSQILAAHEIFQTATESKHALVETMDKANSEITDYFENKDGKKISDIINHTYLKEFSLSNNPLSSKFSITKNELGKILEKLELSGFSLTNDPNIGLGSSNLLFIAAELLLLKKESGYVGLRLSLIEELEAHLHPQSQVNLIDYLNSQAFELGFQSIITTHSNSLASKIDLNNLIIFKKGKAYPLRKENTKLVSADYEFLRRFLDDTKANLFFANGVIIVEGDAENLLIPSFAKKIGYPLHKYGVSIVKVGSTALLRYSKIFQRTDASEQMGIPVSCITDFDVPPRAAKEYKYKVRKRGLTEEAEHTLIADTRKTEDEYTSEQLASKRKELKSKFEGGDVKVFLPETWTLEFEIARSCLRDALHKSITIALLTNNLETPLSEEINQQTNDKVNADIVRWTAETKGVDEIAVEIFAPLERGQASKAVVAQILSRILDKIKKVSVEEIISDKYLTYLVNAIKHAANV
jgi:putative ATP-dependent endonuclease of OLD family